MMDGVQEESSDGADPTPFCFEASMAPFCGAAVEDASCLVHSIPGFWLGVSA